MELLKINIVRRIVVKIRIFIAVRILRKLKTMNSEDAFDVTVKHNLKGLYHCNNRMALLIKPLSVIETLSKDSKILVIGPRNEHDLFLLVSEGFQLKNITGLDLLTYSKHIEIGDMHEMRFDDNSFDAVICGWTLSYSHEPSKAIKEITRVTRDDGIVAIGVEYGQESKSNSEKILGYSIQDYKKLDKRINSTSEIEQLFKEDVKIHFCHNAPNRIAHTSGKILQNVSNVALIVNINK